MPISEELKRVYSSAPSDVTYIDSLMFEHSLFTQTWAIINHVKSIRFRLEDDTYQEFIPIPFEFQLPPNNTQGNQDLSFAICNIGREIMDEIEAAVSLPNEPVKCFYRVYLDQPDTYPQNDPPVELALSQVNFSLTTITASARRFDMLNYPFPRVYYETRFFPGLLR